METMNSKRQERVYLDVCTLCRPFDDQDALRIRLETNAFYLIIQAISDGEFQLIVSPVHFKELTAIRDSQERRKVLTLCEFLGQDANWEQQQLRMRTEQLYLRGFGVADAAHVAYAEASADFFITCDDKLLKRCKREITQLQALNPVAFCLEKELQ